MPPAIPDGYLRCEPGLLIVLDDGQGPLLNFSCCPRVRRRSPLHHPPPPNLDVGDHSLLTADLQGNARRISPFLIRIACRQAVIDMRFFMDSLGCSATEKS